MKTFCILAVAFVTLLGAGCKPPPPTYEYDQKVILESDFAREINRLGADGWEIVSDQPSRNVGAQPQHELLLRRQKR